MPENSTAPEWTCPACGTVNDPDFTRCRSCAAHKPDAPAPEKQCTSCGHSLFSKDVCCPICGSKEFLQL